MINISPASASAAHVSVVSWVDHFRAVLTSCFGPCNSPSCCYPWAISSCFLRDDFDVRGRLFLLSLMRAFAATIGGLVGRQRYLKSSDSLLQSRVMPPHATSRRMREDVVSVTV